MHKFAWLSPLHGVLVPGRHGAGEGEPGVVITALRRRVYSIVPRCAGEAAASTALAGCVGLTLPAPGRVACGAGVSLIWAGRDLWMLAGPPGGRGPDFTALREALGETAALVDHSDARALLRVSGRGARRALARLCAVDLHPRVFTPGCSAATRMAHVGALLHQLDDAPTFEIHVFRAFAASFYHELTSAAADLGYQCEDLDTIG